MDVGAQTLTNTQDIGKLSAVVSELATTMKFEAERMKEDRAGAKETLVELRALNEKISAMAGVQKEMAQSAKELAELRARVDQLKEWKDKYDLSNMNSRIKSLEDTKTEEAGAARAISTGADWFWRLFGPAISALAVAACAWYFTHENPDYSRESTFTEHSAHGKITGE